jgi:hypothetical protein
MGGLAIMIFGGGRTAPRARPAQDSSIHSHSWSGHCCTTSFFGRTTKTGPSLPTRQKIKGRTSRWRVGPGGIPCIHQSHFRMFFLLGVSPACGLVVGARAYDLSRPCGRAVWVRRPEGPPLVGLGHRTRRGGIGREGEAPWTRLIACSCFTGPSCAPTSPGSGTGPEAWAVGGGGIGLWLR